MTRAIASGNDANVKARLAELDRELLDAGVTHFTAREITRLRKAPGTVYAIPPLPLWPNLVGVCRNFGDPLRERIGVPLRVLNGYRPSDYNEAVGGARYSSHLRGFALDVTCGDADDDDDTDSEDRAILRGHAADMFVEMPDEMIGIGFYLGRIHIEWGRRRLYYASPGSTLDDREIEAARERLQTKPIDVRGCP